MPRGFPLRVSWLNLLHRKVKVIHPDTLFLSGPLVFMGICCSSLALAKLLPNILSQLGQDSMDWEALTSAMRQQEGAPAVPAADGDDSDDDIPALTENFDEAE